MRLVILDIGAGNVTSVVRAVRRAAESLGAATRTKEPFAVTIGGGDEAAATIGAADAVVFPGQGSFAATSAFVASEGGGALRAYLDAGRPYLGICLGMQVLFEASDEAPGVRGLGTFAGRVTRLAPGIDPITAAPRPLPHMGWNEVVAAGDGGATAEAQTLFGEEPGARTHYYFAHGFAPAPADPRVVAATTEYGVTFPSVVARGDVFGVQFHPEKSQRAGHALLVRFLTRAARSEA